MPQIRNTFAVHKILKGRYQVNLQEKINHNQSFSEFFRNRSYKLEKDSLIFLRCNPFPSLPSAAQDTFFDY